MKTKTKIFAAAATVILFTVILAVYAASASVNYNTYGERYISPTDISVQGGIAYVADSGLGKLYKTSISGKNVTGQWDASGKTVNAVYAGSDSVYVLSGGAEGMVTKLNPDINSVLGQADAGHTPCAVTEAKGKLYVANRFSGTVTVYNMSTMALIKTIDVGREPIAMVCAGDDLYIARHLMDGAADSSNSTVSADVVVVNTQTDAVTKTIPLTNGSSVIKDICASPDGKYLYVTSTIGRYSYPFTQIDRAWIISNGINIIEVSSKSLLTAVLIDEVELGAAVPWGIDCTEDGTIVVTAAGTNEAIIIDAAEMWKQIDKVKKGTHLVKTLDDIANYLPFLDSARTRVKLDGTGPRAVAVDGSRALICQYFTGNIAVLDIAGKNQIKTDSISLGNQPQANKVREGEILWNDATSCFQQWLSCSSCHPDGRADGLNWGSTGKPHTSTKSMTFSTRTPPINIRGTRATTYDNIVVSFNFDNFIYLNDDQYDAVHHYLKAQMPVQSPYLNRDGTMTESAKRGKILFEEQGCASCHPAPLYTDLKLHDAVIETDNWEGAEVKFDTPTLAEVWRSGAWMNDGSAATLKEAVQANLRGAAVTPQQLDDLTNFVGSIGIEGEIFGIENVAFLDGDKNISYMKLTPETKTSIIEVRCQSDYGKTAKVTMTLYDSGGTTLATQSETLRIMKKGELASVSSINIPVPENLAKGSYYIISITDSASGTKLATDYKIVY